MRNNSADKRLVLHHFPNIRRQFSYTRFLGICGTCKVMKLGEEDVRIEF